MTLKRWVLGKVNPTASAGSGDRKRVAPSLGAGVDVEDDAREPGLHRGPRGRARDTAHLGRYAVLIDAIREALEGFVASELTLHLAIAERDRYLLTSIDVECEDSEQHKELLARFMAEFRPEQIKQYLARDVIAGLRNASAIDLTLFGGLNAQHEEAEAADDPYRELVAQLQSVEPDTHVRPYKVALIGRWSRDVDVAARGVVHAGAVRPHLGDAHEDARRASNVAREPGRAAATQTPLAADRCVFTVQDAAGTLQVELDSIVPGRRYSIGKDPECDIVVDGVYTSRRHCEIWFERGTWWVRDNGSTNGIRVEARGGVHRYVRAEHGQAAEPIELPSEAELVLSARADGTPADSPRIAWHGAKPDARDVPALATPIAPARSAGDAPALVIVARMHGGTREVEVAPDALPFRIGRSRKQGLVVDWEHADVSGRHLEIVAVDESGALVRVLGDSGVTVHGITHGAGTEFQWKRDEEMLLGRTDASATCSLTLRHAA